MTTTLTTVISMTFNPTMVWFYQSIPHLPQDRYRLPFNPTMVWFYQTVKLPSKHDLIELSIPLWSDFIQRIRWRKVGKLHTFQSHYGLILSCNISCTKRCSCKLSIPLWSDFIFSKPRFTARSIFFQSHYGLILSEQHRRQHCNSACGLSIPLWSDFIIKKLTEPSTCSKKSTFQSHYGLILS